ncbi:MAG: hypothetical protein JO353_10470 [Phycisphaerae bacterium]|nr:hypothetical protein [Phycisphaerae bacterium]
MQLIAVAVTMAIPTWSLADTNSQIADADAPVLLASASSLSLSPTLSSDALAQTMSDDDTHKVTEGGGITNTNSANSPTPGEGKNAHVQPAANEIAAATETPNIHGFFNSPFKTGYLTPRGLYVQNSGVSWQPVVGLVFPIGDFGAVKKVAFVGGIWNAVDSYEARFNPRGGPWDEMDVFASFTGAVADDFALALTYGAWNFPQTGGPHTEHNLDLKISYADHWLGDTGITINPYIDCWWAISGSSTVVLGRAGGTGYFEPGIVPTYTWKGIDKYPITFTAPTYFSVGPSTYWDAHNAITHSNFGLFSTGLNASVPLSFIPARYGFWHADAGITYDYLINDSLLAAGTIVSGNTNHNCYVGSVGFGVNF